MKDQHALLEELKPWLLLKLIDFFHAGYETVQLEDLSRYVFQYMWKKEIPESAFERFYQINHISITDYFDFEQIEAQVYRVKTLQELDFSELF